MSVTKVEDAPQPRENLYRLVILVLVGGLVASWVAVVWLVESRNSAENQRDKERAANAAYEAGPGALAAAEQILEEMISFHHRELEDEYAWTEYFADDELREDYEKRVIPRLAKLARATKAVAKGEIAEAAYDVIDEDRVTVLADVRQRVTSRTNKRGVTERQWATIEMVRDGDDWLIDDITIVTVPPPT